MLLGCTNCVDEGSNLVNSRFSMPLTKLGAKQYYLGIFFKVRPRFPTKKKFPIVEFICVSSLFTKLFSIAPSGRAFIGNQAYLKYYTLDTLGWITDEKISMIHFVSTLYKTLYQNTAILFSTVTEKSIVIFLIGNPTEFLKCSWFFENAF